MKISLAFTLAIFSVACGDDVGAADANALADVPSADTAAELDAANDTGSSDVGMDVGADTGPDSGTDAGPADTYENFAMAFMSAYCTECHDAGSSTRDYTTIDDIRRDMVNVRCGVSAEPLDDCSGFPPPRQFPIGSGPMPSDEERGRLVAWIEAGLL